MILPSLETIPAIENESFEATELRLRQIVEARGVQFVRMLRIVGADMANLVGIMSFGSIVAAQWVDDPSRIIVEYELEYGLDELGQPRM